MGSYQFDKSAISVTANRITSWKVSNSGLCASTSMVIMHTGKPKIKKIIYVYILDETGDTLKMKVTLTCVEHC